MTIRIWIIQYGITRKTIHKPSFLNFEIPDFRQYNYMYFFNRNKKDQCHFPKTQEEITSHYRKATN